MKFQGQIQDAFWVGPHTKGGTASWIEISKIANNTSFPVKYVLSERAFMVAESILAADLKLNLPKKAP